MTSFSKEEFEANYVCWFTHPDNPLSLNKFTNQCGNWEKHISRKLKQGWILISKEEAFMLSSERKRLYRAAGIIKENIGDIVFIRNVPNPETATLDTINLFTYGQHGLTFKKENKLKPSFDYKGAKVTLNDIRFFPDKQNTYNEFMYFVACHKIGKPQATDFMTIDDYKAIDYVGIYKEVIN